MTDLIPASVPPPTIPGYVLLRCIGRGSYGEVWLARSDAGEYRAIKVVYRRTFEHDRPFERELSGMQKFEPISRAHPSQVAILQVGVNRPQGYFYYVMELADDGQAPMAAAETAPAAGNTSLPAPGVTAASVASYLPRTLKLDLQRHHRLPVERCVEIGLALSTALQHLHRHGLIHRDIKPSNVIFVRGVPKLADIGLVTDAGASISHVGTEGFLPPEGPGTPQADIYSLGKVLYEIATGHDRMDFPELPTFIEDRREKDQLLELNQVFLKACQNDPRKRYAAARELFADLTLLQSGKSIRRARAIEQRLARARFAAVSLALAGSLIAILNQLQHRRQLNESLRRVEIEREAHLRSNREMRQTAERLAELATGNGMRLREQGDATGALLWFAHALLDEPAPADPGRAQARLRDLEGAWRACPRLDWILPTADGLKGFALASDRAGILAFGDDPPAQLYNPANGAPLSEPLALGGGIAQGQLSPGGDRALTRSADGQALLWKGLDQHPVCFPLEAAAPLTHAAFSPDGRQILGISRHEILLWQSGSARQQFRLGHPDSIQAAEFSPDGKWLASLDVSGGIRSWNAALGALVTNSIVDLPSLGGVCFHPGNRRVAVWGGNQVRLWDARSGDWAAFAATHDERIRGAAFSPDGRLLLSWGDDRTIRLWDTITAQPQAPVWRHAAPLRYALFSPDGCYVASASSNEVRCWNLSHPNSPNEPALFVQPTPVVEMRFTPSATHLVVAGADGIIRGIQLGANAVEQSPGTPASADQWLAWAELLSGRELANGRLVPLSAGRTRGLLTAVGPALRARLVPAAQALWHREEAERRELEHSWFAASFHWARAMALQPGEPAWEVRRRRAEDLDAQGESAAAPASDLARQIPSRSPQADRRLVDLSPYYNAALTESWLPSRGVTRGNDLADLPRGIRKLAGVEFDIRGIIQLSGGALENLGGRFPKVVPGIAVHQHCRRLHLLHGAAWSALTGTVVATYRVHYENGSMEEIRIRFGQQVREWWAPSNPTPLTPGAAIAWEGGNTATRALGMRVRLYQMTWINPLPDCIITTVDLVSAMENPAPFLIACTVE